MLFEVLYKMAQPFLNEKTRGNIVVHKKGQEGFKTLHEEIDKTILPTEFGGTAGDLDNAPMLVEILKYEEYFRSLQKSTKG